MRTIYITGVPERVHPSLRRIADLFFETTDIVTTKEEADLHLDVVEDDRLTVCVATSDNRWERWIHLENSDDPQEWKRKVNDVFLQILEEMTGMKQPWGILTGIRPTKLFHTGLRQGQSPDEIETNLQKQYRIHSEKTALMNQITERQLAALPDLYELRKEVSIYIGIPYCPTKCAYCTFPAYAIRRKSGQVNGFLLALEEEMETIGAWLVQNNIKVTTIYFGGGTPTSITAEEMDRLYAHMYKTIPGVSSVRELTVEAGRPDTITPEKIDVLKKWNIDRISINPQSYTQETLKAIGRHHTVEETIEKYWLAKSMGLDNINMDLILGLPGETTKELKHSLDETEKLMPASLTVHTLSFKRASKMTKQRDKYQVATRDEIGRMMQMAQEWMAERSYLPYYVYRQKNILGNLENTGYSKKGAESLYNIMIMEERQTIIGIGCGAASKFVHPQTGKIERFANPKDPASYLMTHKEAIAKKIHLLNQTFSIDPHTNEQHEMGEQNESHSSRKVAGVSAKE
ncbi:coproporphyrinogen III oxidase [Bacillaceae bacterium SIJ1]|uniref:coproporphyrinogen III oxidase n=1 Tax=Litoribacterium kuwaitense TaxID=1398745 RepID=UPI0013EC512A|nr:coproporphyrinogen III oxidase [Litoribacterium kuwaitense]NGP43895.1 coproporphyrinogen III oxidase [Litoribacterium kuwaitense]